MLGAKVVARAKINLFLRVGDLRDDGFHEIRSVMQALELSDELYFRVTDARGGRVAIRCNEQDVPAGPENLVWRAVDVFDAETGAFGANGVQVLINKRIPVAAGLAGGSADAAATLVALNRIFELDLTHERLGRMAAMVGSDVAFCLGGGTALVSGRGEEVERLEPLPPFHVVLASMGQAVFTAEVYRRLDEIRAESGAGAEGSDGTLEGLLAGIRERDFEAVYPNLRNDLESATMAADEVEQLKEVALGAGARAALMSGSGPTVFALVSGIEEAAEVAWELEKLAPITIVTSFSDRGAELKD